MPGDCNAIRAALATAETELIPLEAIRDVALAAKDVAAIAVDVALEEYTAEVTAYGAAQANVDTKLAQIAIIEQDMIDFGCTSGTGS